MVIRYGVNIYREGIGVGRVVLDSVVVSMLWNGDFPKDEPDRVR